MARQNKIVLISSNTIWNSEDDCCYPGVVASLEEASANGNPIVLVSNRSKPEFLRGEELSFIKFIKVSGRQNGKFVENLVKANQEKGWEKSDIVVLGSNDEDFFMAVNSQSLLIRCDWVSDLGSKIKRYGVSLAHPEVVPNILKLLEDESPWYFRFDSDFFDVYSLTNAGTFQEKNPNIIRLVERLQSCLKDGEKKSKQAFILHFLSSLYSTPIFQDVDVWGYYPSSGSQNCGDEIMAEFVERAAHTYKKIFNKTNPLFIRHNKTEARHKSGGNRDNPDSQLQSIHLNPSYEGKIEGKTIAVLDDYINRGVSFSVSAALLKAAGAKKVIAVSMGKFGNQFKIFDIKLDSKEVYKPMTKFAANGYVSVGGTSTSDAQLSFAKKFKVIE